MKIAILGATSIIAKDLILSFYNNNSYDLVLFGRNSELLEGWVHSVNLTEGCQVLTYVDFNDSQKYDVIINFVGIGDPAKAKQMGREIFKITEQYDNMALDYLKNNTKTKYIFLSTGAVYGGNYQKPVNENTVAKVDINNLRSNNWYAVSKLYAESRHRSLVDLSIVDVRVFNYFSHTLDINSRFLITDIVRAIKNKEVFKTTADNIVRDFIISTDFYNLIQAIIDFKSINTAIDCYTKEPVSKFDLLADLEIKFGLKYQIDKSVDTINASGVKMNYYSINRAANSIGYNPKNTSKDGVVQEINKFMDN